jgi:hypothetical protein
MAGSGAVMMVVSVINGLRIMDGRERYKKKKWKEKEQRKENFFISFFIFRLLKKGDNFRYIKFLRHIFLLFHDFALNLSIGAAMTSV